jgi:hypothetical protein
VASPDGASLAVLDMAARLDSTADFLCHALWNPGAYPSAFGCDTLVTSKRGRCLEFPSPFGRGDTPEEAWVAVALWQWQWKDWLWLWIDWLWLVTGCGCGCGLAF